MQVSSHVTRSIKSHGVSTITVTHGASPTTTVLTVIITLLVFPFKILKLNSMCQLLRNILRLYNNSYSYIINSVTIEPIRIVMELMNKFLSISLAKLSIS